jgi:hypothetical protein
VVRGDTVVMVALSPNSANPLALEHVDITKWELVERPQSPDLVTIHAWKLRLSGYPEDHELSRPLVAFPK